MHLRNELKLIQCTYYENNNIEEKNIVNIVKIQIRWFELIGYIYVRTITDAQT